MASEYPVNKISLVAQIIMGQSPPGSTYNEVGDGLPFYQGVVDFGTRHPSPRIYCSEPTRIAEPGDILFSVRAPIGRVNIATERCCIGRGLAVIRLGDAQDRTFVESVLKGMSNQWGVFEGGGSVFGNARKEDLQSLEIIWPAQGVRRAIAHILGTLDDKIELNRRMNQTLEAMAQALFKSWFVDFEPFRDQGMQDSPLGEIPAGWQCTTVAEVIEVNPPRKLNRGANAIYVDMSALPTASARVLATIKRPYSGSGSRFVNGDVLLARITPCLENGKTALVDFLSDGAIGWGSTEFIVLGSKPTVGTSFIYCLARHQDFRVHAIQAMTGTSGRQRVDTACFSHYWLAIPEAEILHRFEQQVKPRFQKMKANDEESHTLASIRDALLPKLLSGEVRVKDAEKFVESKL
jgi:type I restriction enzyme S subunit